LHGVGFEKQKRLISSGDHPHGGGRGKSKGNRIPMSAWGVQAKSGFKTRPKGNKNKWVVEERYRNFGRRRNKG
jgi:ribosomal protein L2